MKAEGKMIEKRNVDFSFADSRGELIQIVHDGFKQVNVLRSYKGVMRGGHYHKQLNEGFFIISGSVEVTIKSNGLIEKFLYKKNDFFVIPPNVVHSMYFPTNCLMVQMYSESVVQEDGSKDIYTE